MFPPQEVDPVSLSILSRAFYWTVPGPSSESLSGVNIISLRTATGQDNHGGVPYGLSSLIGRVVFVFDRFETL